MGTWGVGMPATLYLERFGELVADAFGEIPYRVGSSLETTAWRDVDIRLILDDEAYERWGFGDPRRPHNNRRWVAFTLAFTAIGREMTGLPVDFQIQQRTQANAEHSGKRSALGLTRMIADEAA